VVRRTRGSEGDSTKEAARLGHITFSILILNIFCHGYSGPAFIPSFLSQDRSLYLFLGLHDGLVNGNVRYCVNNALMLRFALLAILAILDALP
jgi:hypothetical protein